MFQIFFITIYFVFCSSLHAAQETNNRKTPQSMEEMAEDLKARKAALEPFDPKKVKIDIESLGLDDLDKKTEAQKQEEKEPAIKNPPEVKVDKAKEPEVKELPAAILAPTITDKANSSESNPIVPAAESGKVGATIDKVQSLNPVSKIQNFLNKKSNKPEEETIVAPRKFQKTKTEKYINSAKKQSLKKRLAAEKQKKLNEKKREEKLKKLQDLREKYLIQIEKNSSQLSDEDFDESDQKIVPRPKEINRFISDELPAPPILNHYRTADNLHIPLVPTIRERVEVLFNAISSGSVSYFNSAYKDVENSNIRNQNGDTILTYSVLLQKPAIMASVLAKGADPNLPSGLGYTPIDIAIEMLDIKALELLIDNKADPKYIDAFGRTYLMHASRVGFLPAVELFVSKGVDVNAMDNDGFTALSIAYRHKKEIVVKYLLQNGAKTWIEKPYEPGDQSLIKELENRWN
jgi:ankyrin repeat protein